MLIDYGPAYWEAHKTNYTNLSRPHAPIYQEYLKNDPEGLYYSFPRFLRRKHPQVYNREVKTEGPASPEKTIPLDLKHRIVYVAGMDGSSFSSMRLYAEYDDNTMQRLQQDYEHVTYEKGSFYSLSGKKS